MTIKPIDLSRKDAPEPEPEAGGEGREEKISLLLVDDQQANLFALETLLGKDEYDIVRASSGPEALRRILEQDFALVLLDVLMPGMDGFETAELIRKRRQSRHTPIIFITATSSNESHVGQGYSLGAVDYIYKPIIPEILKAKVQVFAELYRKTRRLARSEEALRRELAEREKADAARAESEEKYRKLFSRASDAIVVYDEDGATILDANKAALDLYGYARSEFVGLKATDLEAKVKSGRREFDAPVARSFTGFHKAKGGRVFPVETTVASLVVKGRKLIMALTRDVTERQKAAEAELLAEREIMQRNLVSTVSHELRTPIAAIKAANETLQMGEVENARTRGRFMKIIENQAARLGGLVEDLLLVAELESGKAKPEASAVDLAHLLGELLPPIMMLAKKKTVSIKSKVPAGLVVRADRSHLTGVFQNLLDNAIKYNKKNGSVEITARRDGNVAEVSVRDTGIGIPPADLPLIFQQFHRAPSVRELQIKGTGLGLYIIKTMVDSNGGRIWAEAAPDDDGTVFRFTVPLEKP